jgi:hypothetical protein
MANPNPPLENLKPWQPGQSGNPAGRPRRRPVTDILLDLLDEEDAGGRIAADEVARAWLKAAREGSYQHLKELLDRTEGKVPAPVEQAEPNATVKVEYVESPPPEAAQESEEGDPAGGPV